MSNIIERAAKAAHDARIFIINSDEPDKVVYEHTSPRNHFLYEKLVRAVIAALPEHQPNLGFNIDSSIMPVWCMTVMDNKGEALTVAFSYDQAREIARRINETLK